MAESTQTKKQVGPSSKGLRVLTIVTIVGILVGAVTGDPTLVRSGIFGLMAAGVWWIVLSRRADSGAKN